MPQNSSPKKFYASKPFVYSMLLFVAIVVCGILLFIDQNTRITTIIVHNASSHELRGLESLKGRRYITASQKGIEDDLVRGNPYLKRADVQMHPPHTIEIQTYWLEPKVCLKTERGVFVLSEEGRILEKKEKNNDAFPSITYYQTIHRDMYALGDFIKNSDIEKALLVLKKMSLLGYRVNTVDIDGLDVIRLHLEDKILILSSEKDMEEQLYQIELIIRKLKIEGRKFKRLDLRFDKPILEFGA